MIIPSVKFLVNLWYSAFLTVGVVFVGTDGGFGFSDPLSGITSSGCASWVSSSDAILIMHIAKDCSVAEGSYSKSDPCLWSMKYVSKHRSHSVGAKVLFPIHKGHPVGTKIIPLGQDYTFIHHMISSPTIAFAGQRK